MVIIEALSPRETTMKKCTTRMNSFVLILLGSFIAACSNDEAAKKPTQTKQPNVEINKSQTKVTRTQVSLGTRESSGDEPTLVAHVVKRSPVSRDSNIAISGDKPLGLARCEGKDYAKDQASPTDEDKSCAEPAPQ